MNGIDWPGLMRVGLQGLGLAPEVFWKLTPMELRIILGADHIIPPLSRDRLVELARRFPDGKDRQDG